MAAAEAELGGSDRPCLHMLSAFLALEPPDIVISLAREFGGGSITESVQSCIWRRCISKADLKWQGPFLRRFIKKLIVEIESSGGIVLDELYEYYASCVIPLKDDDSGVGNSKVFKTIAFIFPEEYSEIISCLKSRKLEVRLRSSVNMLEGDTGCSIWPSSLFMSEFILSFPDLFANKCCFEVGSGVGLVGICLSHVKASKVILTDGDFSTLANMKVNLELNHLTTGNHTSGKLSHDEMVHCVCLPWESASDDDLHSFAPDIILGADVIYDPSCLPHLVRVLSALLKRQHPYPELSTTRLDFDTSSGKETSNGAEKRPVAYIASVIRNINTFNCFLGLVEQANLVVTDLTETIKVSDFLPYLRSYDRSSIRIFRIHV
ncbi:S-adenosyl-L-methionine-dependent methyltransferases superfamily protein [Perilla frutescens var. frutescens]|nr:S-adenosyl-L-methionine-dependent methyltransferases superfamily protein [Perilla frutescens var. frutescens]